MKYLLSMLVFGLAICVTSQADAQNGFVLIGDVDGDGLVTWEEYDNDFNAAIRAFSSTGAYNPAADFNKDGAVDFADILPFADILHFSRGDLDRNCSVDFGDIPLFINLLMNGNFDALADVNEDNAVGFGDISSFISALQGNDVPTAVVRELRFPDGDPRANEDNDLHRCTEDGTRVFVNGN